MRTVIDLMREYVSVSDMCKGTPLEDRPWECVKYEGRSHDLGHPTFLGLPENYTFALAVLEGKPVFVGSVLYHKDSGARYTVSEREHLWNWKDWVWTPPAPKRTFMLNGVELPCPSKEETESNHITIGMGGIRTEFHFSTVTDRINVFHQLACLLTEARDKE